MSWKTEPIKASTIGEGIAVLFHADPYYDDNRGQDQLYGHDFLHVLLNVKSNSDTGEEVVAIYQAVLLGKADVATVKPRAAWKHYGAPPSLEEIHAITIPGAKRFVDETVERLTKNFPLDEHTKQKFAIRSPLHPEEITEHYVKAKILRQLLSQTFGRNLGDIPIDELRHLPLQPLQDLIPKMERIYELTTRANITNETSATFPLSGM